MSSTFLPDTYSPQEEERIKELRSRLSDLDLSEELYDSAHLIKWLRARSLDVNKAYEMLKKSLEWRKDNKVDGILEREEIPEEFKKLCHVAYTGLDKEGYPILIIPAGRRNGRELLEKWGKERCMRFNTIHAEMMMDILRTCSKEQGRQVTQMVQIIDMEGFNYRQFASKIFLDFMGESQASWNDNYPELLRYCMVLNAPKAFHIIWNMLKPFIPKETLEKMEVFGVNKEKWKKVIAEKFHLEDIPPHWGGSRPGSDEYCSKDKMWIQGEVPLSFFNFDGDTIESDLTKVTVNARDTLKIRLSVAAKNSSICWRFRTQNHDIGFQILDKDDNELVPYKRAEYSKKQLHEGNEQCSNLGIYTVIFDNAYSWTRSKTVYYNVSVITEGDSKEGNDNPNHGGELLSHISVS